MTTLRSSCAAITLATLTGLGLTACGSDADTGSGSGADAKEASTELTEDNLLEEITKAQSAAGSGHLTLAASEATDGVAVEGDFVVADGDRENALQVVVDLGDEGTAEMRVVGDAAYLSLGELTGDKFIDISAGDDGNPLAGQFSSLTDSVDPVKQLEQMKDHVVSIEQKGDAETIDDVEATPWVVTLDGAGLIADLAEEAGIDPSEVPSEADQDIPFTIYLGPDNLPRRLEARLEGESLVGDYSKWGQDVSIEKPAADEISDEDPFASMAP